MGVDVRPGISSFRASWPSLLGTGFALAGSALALVCAGPSAVRAGERVLSCETNAVNFETNPFAASKGRIDLVLTDGNREGEGEGGNKIAGTWKVTRVDDGHTSSFAKTTTDDCAAGCPFTTGKDKAVQLWAPKPLALSQLADGQLLVLASFDPVSREIKVSSFRDKQMAALERGTCPEPDGAAPEATADRPADAGEATASEAGEGKAPGDAKDAGGAPSVR